MNLSALDLSILKSITTNKKHALDFANDCDSKLFLPEVWVFANTIIGYIRTYKELPTLRVITEKLSKGNNEKQLENIKNVWAELDKIKVNDHEYKHDLDKLKNRFAEKQLIATKDILVKLDPGSIDVNKSVQELQKTVQSIKSLHQTRAFERRTLKDDVSIFRDEYNAKLENPDFDAGVKTGYSYLDHVTDGLRPGELLLIGGESSSGKSLLLMNMALQMWLQNNSINMEGNFGSGYNVLYFSLEMPFKPCRNRVLGRLSSNPTKKIRSASLDQAEAVVLKKALKFIKNYPYQFEIVDIPRGATMEKLELIYEEAKTLYNPQIVVIDYLGLMSYDGPEIEDWLALGKIAEAMHEFSRVHNVITLSAVQLNRAKGNSDEDRIGMHRIGRSALIMHNADIGLQINKRSNESSFPDMEYYVIKCREGELGKGRLIKDMKCGTLLDDKVAEDTTPFEMYDPDDISQKMERLDDEF